MTLMPEDLGPINKSFLMIEGAPKSSLGDPSRLKTLDLLYWTKPFMLGGEPK